MKKLILLLSVILAFGSCANIPETRKIWITCTGSNFSGFYKLNGGITTTFSAADIGNTTYEYEVELEEVESLYISASKANGDDEITITITIYDDEDNVKQISTTSNTITLDYDPDDDPTEDSTN